MLLAIPFALTWTFGKMAGDVKQGIALLSAMLVLWLAISLVAMAFEANGNPKLTARRREPDTSTATQSGGNMEGKEVRFGPAASGLFASSTTGTSTGSINSQHDSYTPIGGAAPLVNIMLGEVDPGGTGSGLYGMLLFALLSVFIAGLMVGRTPEYLGQEDPRARDEARRALHPARARSRSSSFTGDLDRDAERAAARCTTPDRTA